MKLHQAISKFLANERAGKPVFGLMGDANLAYLGDFIERDGGHYTPVVLEGGAVLAATGYARFSGELGVATVTHGPALTNCLTALTEAVRGNTQLVLLTGDTPDVNEFFQYVDIQGFAHSAGAGFERVKTPDTALATLRKAFTRAQLDHKPIVVDIPLPFITAEVDYALQTIPPCTIQRTAPDPDRVDDALGLILGAKRPLLLAGRGAVLSAASAAILNLARLVGAPVTTSLLGREQFLGEPENLGIFGTLATASAIDYMGQADVVLSFGASLNNWQTDDYRLLDDKHVIQVDTDPLALGTYGPIDVGLVGDARATALALTARAREAGQESAKPAYLAKIAADDQRERRDNTFIDTTGGGYVDARLAALRIDAALPAGARQLSDVGRFSLAVWPHITPSPGNWDYAGYFGSIGLGIGTAVGAAHVDSNVPTIVWAGDGGTMQGLIEVNTAVRQRLPLIVVVLNDGCYGAEYMKLAAVGSSPETSFVPWPSLANAAEGLGAHGLRVTTAEELDQAAAAVRELAGRAAAGEDGITPLLIEVVCDPHAMPNTPSIAPVQ